MLIKSIWLRFSLGNIILHKESCQTRSWITVDYYKAVEQAVNKSLAATTRLIRSNETQKKARNLTNCKYFDALSFINYDHFSTPNSKKN